MAYECDTISLNNRQSNHSIVFMTGSLSIPLTNGTIKAKDTSIIPETAVSRSKQLGQLYHQCDNAFPTFFNPKLSLENWSNGS